jgi:hypothetical protein
MNTYYLLLLELFICLIISLIVLRVLSGPLSNVLERICPDKPAAIFWLSYTKVMLISAPLLLVLTVDLFAHFSNPMDSLRLALMTSLAGVLLGLHSIGKRLGQFVLIPKAAGSQA